VIWPRRTHPQMGSLPMVLRLLAGGAIINIAVA
jgi:hypothetical protein